MCGVRGSERAKMNSAVSECPILYLDELFTSCLCLFKTSGLMADENEEDEDTFTVDDAIEKMGFGLFQVILTFIFCLIRTAFAAEYILLHILPFIIRCQWGLSDLEEVIITSMFVAGELVGSLFWGFIADSFGRKKTVIGVTLVMLSFSVFSSIKMMPDDRKVPGFPWILICRFGIGTSIGGLLQTIVYYIEFIPTKMRGFFAYFVSAWSIVGSILSIASALVTMEYLKLGWHWYLAVLAVPTALAFISVLFLPESPRYYLAKGKEEKALKVLKQVSWVNRTSIPEGKLRMSDKQDCTRLSNSRHEGDSSHQKSNSHKPLLIVENHEKPKSFKERMVLIFIGDMWKVTAILPALWAGTHLLVIGYLLLTSTILIHNPHCGYYQHSGNYSNTTTCADSSSLNKHDYLQIIYTNFADFLGLIVALLLIEVIGRRFTLAIILSLTTLGFSLLFICTGPVLLTSFLFLIRAFVFNSMRNVHIYTTEIYPTPVRGLANGMMNFIGRIGEGLAPFVSQVLFNMSDYAAIGTFTGLSLLLTVLALLLPIETKQRLLD